MPMAAAPMVVRNAFLEAPERRPSKTLVGIKRNSGPASFDGFGDAVTVTSAPSRPPATRTIASPALVASSSPSVGPTTVTTRVISTGSSVLDAFRDANPVNAGRSRCLSAGSELSTVSTEGNAGPAVVTSTVTRVRCGSNVSDVPITSPRSRAASYGQTPEFCYSTPPPLPAGFGNCNFSLWPTAPCNLESGNYTLGLAPFGAQPMQGFPVMQQGYPAQQGGMLMQIAEMNLYPQQEIILQQPVEMQHQPVHVPPPAPAQAAGVRAPVRLSQLLPSAAPGCAQQVVAAQQVGWPGEEPETTLMIRNIPNKYSREMLLEDMDNNGFRGAYDFFYLPIDFRTQCNMGYAFVNLTTAEEANRMKEVYKGRQLSAFNSAKICEVGAAKVQGKDKNVDQYRNSAVMSMDEKYHPVVYQNGVRIPFPRPTTAIKPFRLRPNRAGPPMDK